MEKQPTDRDLQEEAYGTPSATTEPITPDQIKKIMYMSNRYGVEHPQTDFTKVKASVHIYDLTDIEEGRLDVEDFNKGLILYGGELMTPHERRIAEAEKRANKKSDRGAAIKVVKPIEPINTIPDMVDAFPIDVTEDEEEDERNRHFPSKPIGWIQDMVKVTIEEAATPGEVFKADHMFKWMTPDEVEEWLVAYDGDQEKAESAISDTVGRISRNALKGLSEFPLYKVPKKNQHYIFKPGAVVVKDQPVDEYNEPDLGVEDEFNINALPSVFATMEDGTVLYKVDGVIGTIESVTTYSFTPIT